jgi:predicted nucleotidyltransferase
MSLVLEDLAHEVGVHERTLRRAVSGGLIRAHRPSSHRLSISEGERTWVRSHWRLIGQLLAALRTEPSVELVVLFGSVARGADVEGISDVDLLVELRRPSPGAFDALHRRLGASVQVKMEFVPLKAALGDLALLSEVLRDGRPLVDRAGVWPGLQARRAETQAQTDRVGRELYQDACAALSYFQRPATERTQPSTARA